MNGWGKKRIVLISRWVGVFVSLSELCLYAPLIVLLIVLHFGWRSWTSEPQSAEREVRAHENVSIGDKDVKRQDVNEDVADKNKMDIDKQCQGKTIVMPPQGDLVIREMPRERPVMRAAEDRTAKNKK